MFYDVLCYTAAASDWQPLLDLDRLFDVRSLFGLAAQIEYVS